MTLRSILTIIFRKTNTKFQLPTTATNRNSGISLEFYNGFVLAEKSNNRKKLNFNPATSPSSKTLAVIL